MSNIEKRRFTCYAYRMENERMHEVRHSLAHLLAAAVRESDPQAKLGIGPVIENGFYYDMLTTKPISENQLRALENKIRALIKKNLAFKPEIISAETAREIFKDQPFKLELIADLEQKKEPVSIYKTVALNQSSDVNRQMSHVFIDLCQGPHVAHTKDIAQDAFRLTKIAGAYWRGSEKNPMLTRIYGVAFATKEKLDAYVKQQEEAARRDHRKIGKELGLFTILDEVGQGLPLFYPKGTILRGIIEDFIESLQKEKGYLPIWIPHITKGELYRISGHLEKYDAMYPPMELKDEAPYYLKPMNCPHFMMLYKSAPHSWRDLPLRWTCTTTNYRYEKSGELSGLTRVRALTQDDCHVFAAPEQIEKEITLMLAMIQTVYRTFGFKDFWVRISTHDSARPENYIGDKEVWKQSEAMLTELIARKKWTHEIGAGEAAFYGPKLDFMFRDALGRQWQLTTIQLDMNLPERFGLEYTGKDGAKKRPIVIHRAILGSTERFLGILIEHYAGAFPLWLAPEQVWILPIGATHKKYAKEVFTLLSAHGIRAALKDENATIGKKIREGEQQKIPYLLIVGDKEMKSKSVAVRKRGKGDLGAQKSSAFLKKIHEEIGKKK